MEADGRPQKKSTSPWLYIGCGCLVAVLVAVGGVVGLGYWGFRKGKEIEQTFKDPKARAEKTREILPYRELPAGYHPIVAMSIPFVMDMAMLGDKEPKAGEVPSGNHADFGEHGFIFINMRHLRDNKEKMERFLRGQSPRLDDSPWRSTVSFDPKDVIRRGTVSSGGLEVLYAASRGELSGREHRSREGIVTMVMPKCPDSRLRFGLWFGPDPAPDKPASEVDYGGTAADPAAVQAFLQHFELCGGKG